MGDFANSASATALRRKLSVLNTRRAEDHQHEVTFSCLPSVIYQPADCGGHGNFLPSVYRAICAKPEWKRRLEKSYTGSAHVPRQHDRKRGELECANSSDALLMNIFCYPRLTQSAKLCALLGIDAGQRPRFGVRANIPMRNDEVDRTEIDMQLGHLLVEAKLTESNFGTASRQRAQRYLQFEEVFDIEELQWNGDKVSGYQLIRGVLAAYATASKFVLLCDAHRADLREEWFQVLRAVRSCEVRSRMALLTWQELATFTPKIVQQFLLEKYGIQTA